MLPVSVVIPSYNRASLLDKTLASLTRQSRKDFQIIVVDHGSTDDTEELCQKHREHLQLSYYKIARDEKDSPGVPRDFGVRRAETPLIIFLDSGTIVPSRYIDAHLAFHARFNAHVGVGLRHGYKEEAGEDLATFLNSVDIDQADAILKQAQLQDERANTDLEHSSIPWFFGWTANLSVSREAYLAAGGFDLDLQGWGFEDGDLCYRLSRRHLKFLFVENGWGVELPQARTAMLQRLESNQKNVLRCYFKQRTLALEALVVTERLIRGAIGQFRALAAARENSALLDEVRDKMRAQFSRQPEILFRYLVEAGREKAPLPALPTSILEQCSRPALLVGGSAQESEAFDYITLADESATSTPSLWSCSGVVLPLPDASLETVVVSDLWKQLNWSMHYPMGVSSMSLLEALISEIQRTARKAIFLTTTDAPAHLQQETEILSQLCQKYELAFQLVSVA